MRTLIIIFCIVALAIICLEVYDCIIYERNMFRDLEKKTRWIGYTQFALAIIDFIIIVSILVYMFATIF